MKINTLMDVNRSQQPSDFLRRNVPAIPEVLLHILFDVRVKLVNHKKSKTIPVTGLGGL
jgi:hypothetical protein